MLFNSSFHQSKKQRRQCLFQVSQILPCIGYAHYLPRFIQLVLRKYHTAYLHTYVTSYIPTIAQPSTHHRIFI
jgi:hypothetical protein